MQNQERHGRDAYASQGHDEIMTLTGRSNDLSRLFEDIQFTELPVFFADNERGWPAISLEQVD